MKLFKNNFIKPQKILIFWVLFHFLFFLILRLTSHLHIVLGLDLISEIKEENINENNGRVRRTALCATTVFSLMSSYLARAYGVYFFSL